MAAKQTMIYDPEGTVANGQNTKIGNVSGAFAGVVLFVLFMGFWINTFLSNQVAYVASVGASSYYFTSSSEKEGSGEIMLGFKWASVTNMGSLAFGSFLIAMIKLIRFLAE